MNKPNKHTDLYFQVSDPEIGRAMLSAINAPGKVHFSKLGKPYVWLPKLNEAEAEDLYHRLWCERSLRICCKAG